MTNDYGNPVSRCPTCLFFLVKFRETQVTSRLPERVITQSTDIRVLCDVARYTAKRVCVTHWSLGVPCYHANAFK